MMHTLRYISQDIAELRDLLHVQTHKHALRDVPLCTCRYDLIGKYVDIVAITH